MLKVVSATIAITALALSAEAADLAVKARPSVVHDAYNWNGFYFGGQCGVAHATSSTNNGAGGGYDPVSVAFVTYDVNDTGATCGLQTGYNWQVRSMVFGIEGELAWLGINRNVRGPGPDNFANADDRNALKYSWASTFTARLGYVFHHTLIYAKGGAALARITNAATDTSGATLFDDPSDLAETTKNRWGWALGAGIEYATSPNWSIKGEYLYQDFGTYRSIVNGDGETYNHRNQLHTFKVGINYRWGG